jgi:hypothetical protein
MAIRGTGFMAAFEKPQRDALAMLFLKLHHHLDVANSALWGVWLIPFGLLVHRSGFLPRLLGVWLMAGCVAFLALSLTGMVFPSIEERVFAFGTPFRVGELATMFCS